MKKIREFLENETIRNFLTILKVFLMVILYKNNILIFIKSALTIPFL